MNTITLFTKTEHQNKHQKYFKYIGIAWFVLGIFWVVDGGLMGWFYLVLGVLHYLFHATVDLKIFATIQHGIYKHNSWFATKTDLTKAKYVKKFAGDVTFVFSHKEVRIDTQMLENESKELLDQFIEKNQIPCEVIPVR